MNRVFIILILFMFFSTIYSQTIDTNESGGMRGNIFGCPCCNDTIDYSKQNQTIYVLLKNRSELAAFKNKRKLWSVNLRELFDSPQARVTCMEVRFSNVDKKGHVISYKKGFFRLHDRKLDRCIYIDIQNRKVIDKTCNGHVRL